MKESIAQSLAGRAALLHLLPFSIAELSSGGIRFDSFADWLSILEASFIIFKLPPYYENFGKRTIKAPKYYFMEPGLLVDLLGIEKPEQVARDPLVGAIFENLVVLECLKAQYNKGEMSNLYFFRDSNGNEIDVLFRKGPALVAVEIKSSTTFRDSHFDPIRNLSRALQQPLNAYLVYNGDSIKLSNNFRALRFDQVTEILK